MKGPKIPELLEKINSTAKDADFSKLSKLEYDLLMQNLRTLYEAIDAARNEVPAETQPVVAPVKKRLLNPNENILINEQVVKKEPEVKIADPVVTEAKPVVQPEVKKHEPVIQQEPVIKNIEKHEPPKAKEIVNKATINELVQTGSSLNEKLKAETKEVHRKLSTRPLKDLIDLNKRFVLLNDLFKGNSGALSSAITHIDLLDDYTTAEAFVKTELSSNYNWDETSQAARLFIKLVKQKFGED